jgi:hypothetical protein
MQTLKKPSLGDIPYRALLVEEGWADGVGHVALFGAVVALLAAVFLSRAVFGSWEVALAAGSFAAAVVGLVGAWAGSGICQ